MEAAGFSEVEVKDTPQLYSGVLSPPDLSGRKWLILCYTARK